MIDWISRHVEVGPVLERIIDYLPNVVAALVLIVFFWGLLIAFRKLADKALRKAKVSEGMKVLIRRFLKYGVVILAGLTIANQLGFNITALVTGLGLAGLAISLAAQDTITNIITGITLAIDRPFEPGDWVRIGETHAQVTALRLRTTVLTTFDNETIVLPNKNIASERIVNYTQTKRIRVRVPIGIAYKEDIDAARKVLLSTTEGDDRILTDPEPLVIVQQLSGSSVDMELRFWILDPWNLFPMHWEYVEKGKKALDKAGIEIPFPHLQLFLEKSGGMAALTGAIEKKRP